MFRWVYGALYGNDNWRTQVRKNCGRILKNSVFGRAVFLFGMLLVLSSCSGNDPSEPTGPLEVSQSLDSDGGIISLGENVHLFFREGLLPAPVTIELEEIVSPAPAPPGWIQVGRAFEARPGVSGFGDMIALGIEFPGVWPDDLTGRRARICRFDETGRWVAVPTSGTVFPESLWGAVYVLGIFAVHVEINSGSEGEIVAEVALNSKNETPDSWSTEATAHFTNFENTRAEIGTGAPVSIGEFSLDLTDSSFSYVSHFHEFQPGTLYNIHSIEGEGFPALQDSVKFLNRELVITGSSDQIQKGGLQETLSITWSGNGPQWVQIEISGEGVDGSPLYQQFFTPNDGEYTISAEQLARFISGSEILFSVKLTHAESLSSDGYHSRSLCKIESSSEIAVMLR